MKYLNEFYFNLIIKLFTIQLPQKNCTKKFKQTIKLSEI